MDDDVDTVYATDSDPEEEATTSAKTKSNKPKDKKSKVDEDKVENWSASLNYWSHLWTIALKNKVGIDLILKVGPREVEIGCHKTVLMLHSPVFVAMLNRWAKEETPATKNDLPVIKLLDDDAGGFRALIKFLYLSSVECDTKKFPAPKLLQMIVLARKYLMQFPLERAQMMLLHNKNHCVNVTNMIELYEMAKVLMLDEMEQIFEEEIISQAYTIFKTDAVLQLSQKTLAYFVNRNDLNINEVAVFMGCLKWAENQCEIQKLPVSGTSLCQVLGEVVQLIRFPVMHEKVLFNIVEKTGIISRTELNEIVSYKKRVALNLINKSEHAMFPYKTESRDRQIALERCKRKKCEVETLDFQAETVISFNVDRLVKLTGVGFFGGANNCTFEVDVKIKVSDAENRKITLSSKIETVTYVAKNSILSRDVFPIYLMKPLAIKPNTRYYVCFTIKGAKTFFSRSINYKCTQSTYLGKVNFSFHKIKANRSGVHFGQMPFLYYRFPLEKGGKDAELEGVEEIEDDA